MLVYGDRAKLQSVDDVKAGIEEQLRLHADASPGIERHALLVDAFIRTGELVRGIADAEFEAKGGDDVSCSQDRGADLLLQMAHQIARSWEKGFAVDNCARDWSLNLKQVEGLDVVGFKQLEGYAFYALYPEAYIEAARRSGLGPKTIVIGIRSIGTSLAAVVAAALGAAPAITVRPGGHPFRRSLSVLPGLADRLLADPLADFAIVDEGPGLSGSSFGSVADWLVMHGVTEDRLHFFPSHAGDPGPKASDEHRARWARCRRHVVSFEDLLLRTGQASQKLENWIADAVGPLTTPLLEISGGAWRQRRYASHTSWPPSDRQNEKRKFLAQTVDGCFLVKFAGLGLYGSGKLKSGDLLAAAGFTPEIMGFRHGFLIQRWCDGQPVKSGSHDDRSLVEKLGDYLSFRASLPADTAGAGPSELFEMAVFNIGEALGEGVGDTVKAVLGDPHRFAGRLLPVHTDNRMQPWEWVQAGGRLLKTDALDHSAAHDLIGCQDIAWDIAGASVEFDLPRTERQQLVRRLRSDSEVVDTLEVCYIAFQLGLWTFARWTSPDEAERIGRLTNVYERRLRALIARAAAHKSDRAPAPLP